jgi:excisionase family DNA binding protein
LTNTGETGYLTVVDQGTSPMGKDQRKPMRRAFAAEARPETEPTLDLREVMNIQQASEYLGVSPDTLYKYLSRGSIPAFKLGNRWRFKRSTLDRWMEKQSQPRDSVGRKRTSSV